MHCTFAVFFTAKPTDRWSSVAVRDKQTGRHGRAEKGPGGNALSPGPVKINHWCVIRVQQKTADSDVLWVRNLYQPFLKLAASPHDVRRSPVAACVHVTLRRPTDQPVVSFRAR